MSAADTFDASADIIEFSKKRSLWQQDALRRLAVQGTLTDADINEFLTVIKVEHSLLPKEKLPALMPLAAAHLASTTKTEGAVVLKALSDAQNVNQLKPGERLDLAAQGLTLIYGDNGSGKSGYTRIFKKASAARSVEDILADVFSPDFEKKPAATATFHIAVSEEGKEREEAVAWDADKGSPEVLRQCRVFDRRAAVLYVEKDTDLEFVPFNLDLLDGLLTLCAALKERLETEGAGLDATRTTLVGAIPVQEAARQSAEKITAQTKQADLDAAALWTDKDAERLKALKDSVETSETALKTLRLKKGRLDVLLAELQKLEQGLAKTVADSLSELVKKAGNLRQAAEATGKAAFSKDPRLLPGVGGVAWQALWEAARAYSTQGAYPGATFPVTEMGEEPAQCVLCQQDLSAGAADRLKAFESFVKGEVEKKAKAAEREVLDAKAKVIGLGIAQSATVDEIAVDDEALAKSVRTFYAGANARKASLVAAAESRKFDELSVVPDAVTEALKAHIAGLQENILAAERAVTEEQKAKDKAEISTLSARKSHSDHKQTLEKLLANRATHAATQACLPDVATNAVSRAKKDLNEKYVTTKFKDTLGEELAALSVRRKVTLSQKAASVRPVFVETTFAKLEKVLSDGEHRAVALACFLAESRMLGTSNSLIIDDPVSSLDHIRREQVARRLVEEAKKRQVIVFTHDMVFWGEVCYIAGEEKVPVLTKDLRRDGGLCGKVGQGEVPWPILPVKNRLQLIEAEKLPQLRKLYEAEAAEYRTEARHVGGLLRETWERLIEETLFQETVVRYRRSIETNRLVRVAVEDTDWEKIHRGMTRTSRWAAHDESRGTGGTGPTPDELRDEVKVIRELSDELQKQSKDRGERRKKALDVKASA